MSMRKLFVSNESFSIIQPILLTARTFGLFPVTYSKIGNRFLLRWSTAYAVYSYMIIAVIVIQALVGTLMDCLRDQNASLRMTSTKNKVVTCIDVLIIIVDAVFGSVTLRSKVKKFWKVIQCLNKADKILPLRRPEPHRRRSILLLSSVLSTATAIVSFDLYGWGYLDVLNAEEDRLVVYLRDYGCFYFLIYATIVKELFFAHVVYLIEIRLEVVRLKVSAGERVAALSRCYSSIVDAADAVSSSVEYGVIILVLYMLLNLVVSPYFLLNELITTRRVVVVMLQLLWTLVHFARLLMIVESCQRCSNQQQKLFNSACKLLCENSNRPFLRDEISALVHQIGTRKIELSACGFFPINRTLLTSVLASVATYLVILLQIK